MSIGHFLVLFCLLIQSGQILADTIEGRVVGVSDGDTVTVLDGSKSQHKIRLAGIDAPESKQAFGNVAKKRMADMVFGKEVRVDYRKTDKYGRTIGCIWVASAECQGSDCPKTLDAGKTLLTMGLAWHYKQYANEQPKEEREQYSFAEFEARVKKVGLWIDAEPVPPWDWRKAKREK